MADKINGLMKNTIKLQEVMCEPADAEIAETHIGPVLNSIIMILLESVK